MPQQHELFAPPKLELTPATGQTGPRLWVRRLSIWKEPGGELIRTVTLRPGLNIIWSPDGADSGEQGDAGPLIGHGSGKTLFCRLLRYCLGEQRFADEEQREHIAAAFPDGIVGAEVMLDGICWAVVRSLGPRRRHVAVANGNLDEIAAGDGPTTSIDPLIDAIEQNIVTTSVAELIRAQPGQKAWPVALAWLTRDQECRFDDVLDWRSPASGSDAPLPASGRETGPRRDALRAFLMAITTEEQVVRRTEEGLRADIARTEQEIGYLDWDKKRRQEKLITDLGLGGQPLPDMPMLIEVMRKAANDRLAAAADLPSDDVAELSAVRQELEKARSEFEKYSAERCGIESQIPPEQRVLTLLKSEIPGLSSVAETAASPVCPICEVPIDKAVAEGCGLSHKLHDETACRARLAEKHEEIEKQTAKINALELRAKALLPEIALAQQAVERCEKRVQAIEGARDQRASAWQLATRLNENVQRLSDVMTSRDDAKKNLGRLEASIVAQRDRLASFRDRQGGVFGRVTGKFDPIIRRLVRQDAKGTVVLTGRGLDIKIDAGGDRKTSAIESLKVLAFDLACLCLSIEGFTHVPAFFVHDSPREADLGLSIYNELFQFVRDLEAMMEVPLFQYIVTTTTQPPKDLQTEPWLRLRLLGSPGSARLLKRDL